MIFLDANLILRALVRPGDSDARRLSDAAGDLLRQAQRGEVEVTTSDAVLAEVAFILTARTHYHLPVSVAAGQMSTVARLRGFRHRDKRVILRALEIWTELPRIGFVDALTAAYAETPGMLLATFDTDFDALSGINRWRPREPI